MPSRFSYEYRRERSEILTNCLTVRRKLSTPSDMNNTYTTKTGLVLPLLNLKGKAYLDVASRVLWFRTEHPLGRIESEPVQITDTYSVFKATVSIPDTEQGVYVKLSDGYKREDAKHFPDFIEKSSTGAIGRALALCGYGTQFAHDFDEGDRVVDAPRDPFPTHLPKVSRTPTNTEIHQYQGDAMPTNPRDAGPPFSGEEHLIPNMEDHYVIGFGKYKGRAFNDIPPKELIQYAEYITSKARAQGESITNRDTMYFLDRVRALK